MTRSWWLKFKRAQRHMIEINHEIRRYTKKHAYRPVRVRHGKRKDHIWTYKLDITEQPNAMLAVMLGDFLFNLRSALDHVLSACAPNKRANRTFPIFDTNVLGFTLSGEAIAVLDKEAREKFLQSISGLDDTTKTTIISFQPWLHPVGPHLQPLSLISRLNNRDKHRELSVVATGVRNVVSTIQARGWTVEDRPTTVGRFVKADAIVLEFTDTNRPRLGDSEVHVELSSEPLIYVESPRTGGNQPPDFMEVRSLMLNCLAQVRSILRQMEPFVKR